jgi:hypothetical protein
MEGVILADWWRENRYTGRAAGFQHEQILPLMPGARLVVQPVVYTVVQCDQVEQAFRESP